MANCQVSDSFRINNDTTTSGFDDYGQMVVALGDDYAVVAWGAYNYVNDDTHPEYFHIYVFFHLVRLSDRTVVDYIEYKPPVPEGDTETFGEHVQTVENMIGFARLNDQYAVFGFGYSTWYGNDYFLIKRDGETMTVADRLRHNLHYAWAGTISVKNETEFFLTYSQIHDTGFQVDSGRYVEETRTYHIQRVGDSLGEISHYYHDLFPWPAEYPDSEEPSNSWRPVIASHWTGSRLLVVVGSWRWANYDPFEGLNDYMNCRLLDPADWSIKQDLLFQIEVDDVSDAGGFPRTAGAAPESFYPLSDSVMLLIFPRRRVSPEQDTVEWMTIEIDSGITFAQGPIDESWAHANWNTSVGPDWLVGVTVPSEVNEPDLTAWRIGPRHTDVASGQPCIVQADADLTTSTSYAGVSKADRAGSQILAVWHHWPENTDHPNASALDARVVRLQTPPLRFVQRDDEIFENNPSGPRVRTASSHPTTRQNSIRHSGQTYW